MSKYTIFKSDSEYTTVISLDTLRLKKVPYSEIESYDIGVWCEEMYNIVKNDFILQLYGEDLFVWYKSHLYKISNVIIVVRAYIGDDDSLHVQVSLLGTSLFEDLEFNADGVLQEHRDVVEVTNYGTETKLNALRMICLR